MYTSKTLPVLPIRNTVIFPGNFSTFLVRREGSVEALERLKENDGFLVAVAQRVAEIDEPSADELYQVGTLVKVEKITGSREKGYQIQARGVSRFKIGEFLRERKHWAARGEVWSDLIKGDESAAVGVLMKSLKQLAKQVLELLPQDASSLVELLNQIEDPGYLSYVCAQHLEMPVERRQSLLEQVSVKARLLEVLELMQKQRDALQLQGEIQKKMSRNIGKSQREAILREQMKTIREELGDEEAASDAYSGKIAAAEMPEEARRAAEQELKRLEAIGPSSPESHVIRNYLDWLCAMPWKKSSGFRTEDIDLGKAREILDQDHFGLDKIKTRILQHLAVMKLKKQGHGSILCFVGPPGVGKTSLGQSIGKALGRKFVRASLGGMRDDAEIRGHRRTYIGALPGRIIQSIKRAGENDPVFLLDEIDKLSHGFYGDPASAMLEVLDPEQNSTFTDHYLDVPFDLSSVFFIATANTLDTVPAPLLDRMEVIELTGYTQAEKLDIAKRHLVPKQLKAHGLSEANVIFSDETLSRLISHYTRESGVRELQRRIGALCRAAAERHVRSSPEGKIVMGLEWLEETFGPERFPVEAAQEALPPGVATGLAWTPMGGEILFIEASQMPGKGALTLTGQLGDVMKESAQIALSLVRSRLPLWAPEFQFHSQDIHIHVPAGAIPKDGPSAGITMFTTLASLLSGRSVDPKIAMTGELTLRGAVMPVGGIKEKVIAAHRAGIREVILSAKNRKDLRDVPEEVRKEMRFEFVENVNEVLKLALGLDAAERFVLPSRAAGPGGQTSAVA